MMATLLFLRIGRAPVRPKPADAPSGGRSTYPANGGLHV
jgi:hypothetical protein